MGARPQTPGVYRLDSTRLFLKRTKPLSGIGLLYGCLVGGRLAVTDRSSIRRENHRVSLDIALTLYKLLGTI